MALWASLVRELRALGHDVEYLSVIDEADYRGRRGALRVLAVRFRMLLLFPLLVLWRLWTCRASHDFILVPTTPPFLPALAAALRLGPRLQVVHMMYDLYPDLLYLSNQWEPGSLRARFLAACTRYALARSSATVFLGERLKAAAESRYGPATRGTVIEVGSDGSMLLSRDATPSRTLRVLYSGNLGAAHDVDTLVEMLRSPLPSSVTLAFHAYGSGYQRLKQAIGPDIPPGVELMGPLADADWAEAMRQADVALITLRIGAEDVCFPSKLYSAMLAGQAIIAVCASTSDLADTVRAARCGQAVEPGDVDGLRGAITNLATNPQVASEAGRRAAVFAKTHFDMPSIARKWANFLACAPGFVGPPTDG
jgi:glycosyltransferase involved in cell wall biosynthesis